MIPRILALDPSLSCTGWASCDPTGNVSYGTLRPPAGCVGVERLEWFWNQFRLLRDHEDPALIAVESYAFARVNQAHQLGELGGILRLCLKKTPRVELAPAARAKWATGKGNAGKDEVLTAAVKQLGYQGHSNDEADALWILDCASHAYGFSRAPLNPLAEYRRDVLAAVAWPTINGVSPSWVKKAKK